MSPSSVIGRRHPHVHALHVPGLSVGHLAVILSQFISKFPSTGTASQGGNTVMGRKDRLVHGQFQSRLLSRSSRVRIPPRKGADPYLAALQNCRAVITNMVTIYKRCLPAGHKVTPSTSCSHKYRFLLTTVRLLRNRSLETHVV